MYHTKKICPISRKSCGSDCAWFDDVADCGMLAAIKDFSLAMQELLEFRRQSQTTQKEKYRNINHPQFN